MPSHRPAVVLLAALLLAAAPAAAAQEGGDRVLTADDLAALIDGGAAWDFRAPGSTGTQTFAPDGSARITWTRRDGSGGGDSAGAWRRDGNALCTRWDALGQGRETCVHFYRFGTGVYRTLDARTGDDRAVLMPPGTPQD